MFFFFIGNKISITEGELLKAIKLVLEGRKNVDNKANKGKKDDEMSDTEHETEMKQKN